MQRASTLWSSLILSLKITLAPGADNREYEDKVFSPPGRYMTRHPPIWLVVLLYVVFSTLWIVIAGYLISLTLDDPVLRSRAYLAKELILVAVSSGLFYLLLKSGGSRSFT